MIERHYITPANMYKLGGGGRKHYTPVVVVKTNDHVHIYVAGRTARGIDEEVKHIGDMRGQLRLVCENTIIALESVGATIKDVVRTVTYVTDVPEYYRVHDERFKYFPEPLPTNTLIGVTRLGMPDMLVEIECEAIMEPERVRLPQQ
jgi:enamine deaminase RidA (YjgF/YER057c/UK114 family)